MKNGASADEAIAKAMDGMTECFSAEKSIMASGAEIDVPTEVQEKINADLDDFIEHCGLPKGIFEWLV